MDKLSTYVVDLVGDVVSAASTQVLSTLINNETATLGKSLMQTVNYQYGHKAELIADLMEKDRHPTDRFKKYPLVYLVMDFPESAGTSDYLYHVSLNLLLMHQTEEDDRTKDRYAKVFKPVLYPLYNAFLKRLYKNTQVHAYSPYELVHTKIDHPRVTVVQTGEEKKSTVADYCDAIEISNLSLLLDFKTCIN